eukprot:351002-Chlamydomonas_euryale.AAC.19
MSSHLQDSGRPDCSPFRPSNGHSCSNFQHSRGPNYSTCSTAEVTLQPHSARRWSKGRQRRWQISHTVNASTMPMFAGVCVKACSMFERRSAGKTRQQPAAVAAA